MIITLLSRPARWWNPFRFPLLCSPVPLPQSPNPNFIQLLPQSLHRSKTSNMIFAVFAFLSIWHSIYTKCPKKMLAEFWGLCWETRSLDQSGPMWPKTFQIRSSGPRKPGWPKNLVSQHRHQNSFLWDTQYYKRIICIFSLLSTGGREWAPSSMKAPLLGTECSARRLPAIDFYFRYIAIIKLFSSYSIR